MLADYLLIVDVQNDFVSGVLGSEQAQKVVPNIVKRTKEYIDANKPIIVTIDTHFDNYLETQEGQKLPIKHCMNGTEGQLVVKELDNILRDYTHKTENTHYVLKEQFGSEKLPSLMDELTDNESASIEILGLDTDCCVLANAVTLRTMCPQLRVIINQDCCAGTDEIAHDNALEIMETYQMEII
jgi:nicotinamidase-related amidase